MRPARRARLAAALLASVAVALAGCAASPGADVASPTPTSAAAQPPSPSAAPAAEPHPTVEPHPTADAEPTHPAAPPYCGDDYVLAATSTGPTSWMGTEEEVLAALQPAGRFEPAGAIEGLDVVCVATYRIPVDGAEGIGFVSEAVLDAEGTLEHLEAWAPANGYLPLPGTSGFVERHAPANPDGTTTMKLKWAPLAEESMSAVAEHVAATTEAAPDAIHLWHVDFTQ